MSLFTPVQVISRWVVERAQETSTCSWSRFCTVNCRPTASNYQLSHLRSGRKLNPDLRGGRRECSRINKCQNLHFWYFWHQTVIWITFKIKYFCQCSLLANIIGQFTWGVQCRIVLYTTSYNNGTFNVQYSILYPNITVYKCAISGPPIGHSLAHWWQPLVVIPLQHQPIRLRHGVMLTWCRKCK